MTEVLHTIIPYIPPRLVRPILMEIVPMPPLEPLSEQFAAAVLFADVSGFTPLTEALAQQGEGGAEEIANLLNDYFSSMIAIVEAEGGEVARFSGDALIVLFPATENEPLSYATRRAVQAATTMQSAMTAFDAIPTSVGLVSLGMKIIIGAGDIQTLLVGGILGRWEYIVAGDPLVQVAAVEAKRGENVLSSAAQAIMWPLALPARPLPPLVINPQADPQAMIAALCGYVPGAAQPWLALGLDRWMTVLRPMSVMFCEIGGLEYGQPATLDQVQACMQTLQDVIYTYEGSINKLSVDDKGTVLLVLFGAPPLAHPDDAVRAVRSALHLQSIATSQRLQFGIGVTTGWVFAGPVGGERRREYTVMGDTVNLAARLMQAAGNEGILCDHETFSNAHRSLMFETIAPVRPKGRTSQVRVYRPTGETITVPPVSSFIGRQAEREQLQKALSAVQAGESRIMLLEGEPGIGKSRLIGELVRLVRSEGLTGLRGEGLENETRTPYRAWRDVFISYFSLDGTSDPSERRQRVRTQITEVAPELLGRLPLLNDVLALGLPETSLTAALNEDLRHRSLIALLVDLLRRWVAERPLVLVLEDAHWMDSLSWKLALAIVRGLTMGAKRTQGQTGLPIFMLLALRPIESVITLAELGEMAALPQVVRIRLAEMPADDVVTLAATHLGVTPELLPEPVAKLVRERSGGNPFFAEELVLALRDGNVISVTDDEPARCVITGDFEKAARNLPATVQGVILARLDRLQPEQQVTLRVSSVIGRQFAYRTLHALLHAYINVEDVMLRVWLELLARLDITLLAVPEPDLSYMFRHIITHEVAYRDVPDTQRRTVHRAVAKWYERTFGVSEPDADAEMSPISSTLEPYLPILAYHYGEAEDRARERYYARLAGEHAAAHFANNEAVVHLSRALALTPDEEHATRYALVLAREQVYHLQGTRIAQQADLDALEELAEQLSDHQRRLEVALRRARYADVTSDYPAMIEAAQRAIMLAHTTHDRLGAATGHLHWARALWYQATYQQAQAQAEQALTMARAIQAAKLEAEILRLMGNIVMDQGRYDEARRMCELALQLHREQNDRVGESYTLNNLGTVAFFQSNYDEAFSLYHRFFDLSQAMGDRYGQSMALFNLGEVSAIQGNLSASKDCYEQSLALCRAIGAHHGESMALTNVGDILRIISDYQQARESYEQALSICERLGNEQQ